LFFQSFEIVPGKTELDSVDKTSGGFVVPVKEIEIILKLHI
jgi:hypothetical protein